MVGSTGHRETLRFTIAIGSLKERASMFNIGNKQTAIIPQQTSKIITLVKLSSLVFFINKLKPPTKFRVRRFF